MAARAAAAAAGRASRVVLATTSRRIPIRAGAATAAAASAAAATAGETAAATAARRGLTATSTTAAGRSSFAAAARSGAPSASSASSAASSASASRAAASSAAAARLALRRGLSGRSASAGGSSAAASASASGSASASSSAASSSAATRAAAKEAASPVDDLARGAIEFIDSLAGSGGGGSGGGARGAGGGGDQGGRIGRWAAGKGKWVMAGALGLFVLNPVRKVPAGHVGVVDLFGDVKERTLDPGLHLVVPFSQVVNMSMQTQRCTLSGSCPTAEGLMIDADITILYKLATPESARDIYKTVGREKHLVDRVLNPVAGAALRTVISGHEAKDLYASASRQAVSDGVSSEARQKLTQRGVVVEDTLLKRIVLPRELTHAIEEKLNEEQRSLRMHFVLERERQEAQRKAVEAEGIAEFQRIVAEGVSEPLLRWKGIEATERLASSDNTKIVVVGGKDGLPLILNN